jgi:phage gp29-like protein
MAEETQDQPVPALPPRNPVVTEQALYLTEISLYRNTLAFGGTRNPTSIWASMQYNTPYTMGYYRELEDKDEDVSNALDTLKYEVTKRARSIEPANDTDSMAVDTKEFIEQQLEKIDFEDLLDCILDAAGYGFSVQELMFDVSAGQAALTEVADCPQELFLFGNRFRPQVGNLQYLDNPFDSEGLEVPENKFLVTTYRKRARNRMGRPLLKNVFWPSWFKRNMERLWLKFAEKGPGTAVVRYNDPDNIAEKQKAAELAQAIIDSVAVGVPKTMEIETELLKIARSQSPSVYKEFYTLMQYAITRRIQGQTLTTFGNEGGKGSNAQGQTHADTLQNRGVYLARLAMRVVNHQLIRPLTLWNFGPQAPVPNLAIDIEPEEDLVERLAIDAGLQRMGKKFTVGYVVERYGAPLAAGENGESPEDILVPNISAPNVGINDQARATFAEAPAGVRREMVEFDRVFEQLKKDSTGVLKDRVAEIARDAIPVERR